MVDFRIDEVDLSVSISSFATRSNGVAIDIARELPGPASSGQKIAEHPEFP
jgi:hypothetical protein